MCMHCIKPPQCVSFIYAIYHLPYLLNILKCYHFAIKSNLYLKGYIYPGIICVLQKNKPIVPIN